VIAVDYLAFYQTAAFAENKWRIQYLAPVLGHELTTRAELLQDELDHPSAQLEYYKVQLGAMIRLPDPILADKWRRITFFYTTGEHLRQAAAIRDLIVPSEERRILWQALRERASQAQNYVADKSPEFEIDPAVLASLLGIKDAETIYNNAPMDNTDYS